MEENFTLGENNFTRRSVLGGAVALGGGAVLSAAIPSFALPTAQQYAVEPESIPARNGAEFSESFLSNRMFTDLPLNFDPSSTTLPFIDPELLKTGAFVQPNGDVLFRIYAPNAKNVTLKFDLINIDDNIPLVLTKRDNGVFESLLAFNENHTGPLTINIFVDGAPFLSPFMPIHWSASCPRNFIEIPDLAMDFMMLKDVPHGAVTRHVYWVDALKSWERCTVYAPPGYMKSTQEEYPVLYLQHGGGENETVWQYCGKVPYILDNLISENKAKPFLVVMNDDMLRYRETPPHVIDLAFEKMLIESCIPFIEKNYRVKSGKWNRAIAGTSMGCMMSCDIAFRHPEVFGNLGTLNASMTHDRDSFNTTYVRPFPEVMKDAKKFGESYKIYYRSTMTSEDHFPYFLADDKLCEEGGIDKLPNYHRIVYPARTGKWNGWRMGFRDFSKLLFR